MCKSCGENDQSNNPFCVQTNVDVMSSVQLQLSSDEKMNMYENMVEDLVNSDDESSRYMLDGKKNWQWIESAIITFCFSPVILSANCALKIYL